VTGASINTFLGVRTTVAVSGSANFTYGVIFNYIFGNSLTVRSGSFTTNTLGPVQNIHVGFATSIVTGGAYSEISGMSSVVRGGLVTATILGGRTTNITGLDFKTVTGMDMKIVDFACDVKVNTIEKADLGVAVNQLIDARKYNLKTELGQMVANATSLVTFL
jgi:hypothetical protein